MHWPNWIRRLHKIWLRTSSTHQGYVDELSEIHIAGWVWNPSDPLEPMLYEAVIPATGEVLARGTANQFRADLRQIGVGDGSHAFRMRLGRKLKTGEAETLVIRTVKGRHALKMSSPVLREYLPVRYIIMDLVDNCNIRCPFCLFDYTGVHTTNMMDEATIDAIVRFAPFVYDSAFWFSCLHEPALHPRLMEYIEKVPSAYRRKLFFTTNLAKRMPSSYFSDLADSGLHHVNVSIESLDPNIYERMRKGARHRIFMENWDSLLLAFGTGKAVPALHYISMVYKSNFRNLPAMVDHLLTNRGGAKVELRDTYDLPHIPEDFRRAEFLTREEWLSFRDEMARFPPGKVQLDLPPGLDTPAVPAAGVTATDCPAQDHSFEAGSEARGSIALLPHYYGFSLSWNGTLEVNGVWESEGDSHPVERKITTLNVRDISDPLEFVIELDLMLKKQAADATALVSD